jgi:lipoprotein signal peptidase
MPFNIGGLEVFPPIWNIADAAISIGVIWIVLNQKKFFQERKERHEKKI